MGELSGDNLDFERLNYVTIGIQPLTPPPSNLTFASQSSPWNIIWRMLGVVFLVYIIANLSVAAIYGLFIGDPSLATFSLICSLPLVLLFLYSRRPKLTHVMMATPSQEGSTQHNISQSRVLFTPIPTKFTHHLLRDSPPLELPKTSTLWFVFSVTIIVAFLGMLPVFLSDNPIWLMMAVLVGVPAWLFGFSLPVHAWWGFSTKHFQLRTTKSDGEKMLVAGMLSTIPALSINSLIFPLIIGIFGIDYMSMLGEFLILTVSAPVGEELCKAAFVLALYKLIDSPKRGFQIGFSVGLGFALLENLQYILFSFAGGPIGYSATTVIRGLGSIPGHAIWTGLSGVSIGWYICIKKGIYPEKQEQNGNWVLYDKTSGFVKHSQLDLTNFGIKMREWLYKPFDKTWKLPINPMVGIALAISGHAFWNGSYFLISYLFIDTPIIVMIIANLTWTIIMIGTLYYIGKEILAAVMHIP